MHGSIPPHDSIRVNPNIIRINPNSVTVKPTSITVKPNVVMKVWSVKPSLIKLGIK